LHYGKNDESVARVAPLAIGIQPVSPLKEIVKYRFNDFSELMKCEDLLNQEPLIGDPSTQWKEPAIEKKLSVSAIAKDNMEKQLQNFAIEKIAKNAMEAVGYVNGIHDIELQKFKSKYSKVIDSLQYGEKNLLLYKAIKSRKIDLSNLQPFCNATELMIHLYYLNHASEKLESVHTIAKRHNRDITTAWK
jgi:hypothetical protein